jgi:hypothetical protein
MMQPKRSSPRHIRPACALILALACGLAPAALSHNGVQWRLKANVPVMCAILAVDTPADRPGGLAIATTCNAERFQLVLHDGVGPAGLRAARSSAGPVQINGAAITITSTRPGYALTTIDLAAPISRDQQSVTLQPI